MSQTGRKSASGKSAAAGHECATIPCFQPPPAMVKTHLLGHFKQMSGDVPKSTDFGLLRNVPEGHSSTRDECSFPLDPCPAPSAVQLLVFIFTAGGHQEWGFVGDEIVNADVMRCLQSAPTFQRLTRPKDLRSVTCGGRATSVVQNTRSTPRIGEPLGHTEGGRYQPRLEWNKSHPLAKSGAG
jgi:hypothetical protein